MEDRRLIKPTHSLYKIEQSHKIQAQELVFGIFFPFVNSIVRFFCLIDSSEVK